MPSVSSVELTNTFDEWRQRTNDVVTIINAANSADPVSAIAFANSEGGFTVNTITSSSVTGTLVTGTRLVMTGGNVNFTSANVASAGNVHQMHVLGGSTIDVSLPSQADTSLSNTFIYNSKINLNGQKFVSGASTIDLDGATITNLGSVAKLTSTAASGGDVTFTNPRISITSSVGSLTISSGTQDFSGATIASAILTPYTARAGVLEASNVVVNGAGFLVSTNSTAFGLDVGTANVGIGKFPEITTNITSEKRPTSSKSRLHVRTDFAAGGTTATAVESVADELILENLDDAGMTILTGTAKNNHITFGNSGDPDVGGIIYDHDTEDMHFVTDSANTVIFSHSFGGSVQIVGGDTVGTPSGKLHVNVGSTDATSGVLIDSNDADQKAISVSASQTTMNVFQIDSTTLTTGSAIAIYDNSPATGARNILNIDQDHLDATGGIALNVKTDGMQLAKFQTTKSSATGVTISSSSGLAHAATLLEVTHDGDSTTDTVKITSKSTTGTQKVFDVANTTASLFTVTASNQVGINDSTPSYTLDVNGNGRFTGDVFFNNDIFVATRIYHQDDTDTYLTFGADTITATTGGTLQINMESAVSLFYNGSEKLKTASDGVDITGRLDVSSHLVATSSDANYLGPDTRFYNYLYHYDDTDTYMTFNGTGDTNQWGVVTGGSWAFYSNSTTAYMYYNGTSKLNTTSSGVYISDNTVNANGVNCRLAVYNSSGTLVNSA